MKVNEKRIYPYPIFRPFSDDYNEVLFETGTVLSYNLDEATLSFNIKINDPAICNLVLNQDVGVYCHVECPKTKFRKAFELLPKLEVQQEINIPLSHLNEDVEVICFLVAKKEIVDFKDENLIEFYNNVTIRFPQYSIVGYTDPYETKLIKAIDVDGNIPSIFSVTTIPEITKVEYTSDVNKIYVCLPKDDYQIYHKYRGKSQKLKQMMIILPVLVEIIKEIQEDCDSFSSNNWYNVLEMAFDKYGYDDLGSDEFKNASPLKLAQTIMPELSKNAFVEFDMVHSDNWRDE